MNKRIVLVISIAGLSVLAFLLRYYVIEWSWKKSLIISGSAGVAMIVFDVFLSKKIPNRNAVHGEKLLTKQFVATSRDLIKTLIKK